MACKRGGMCPHSARKMQWAVHYYKSRGGRYSGPKRSYNSLARWTRQKWRTQDGSPSEGKKRYLPSDYWRHLSPSQMRRTNEAKRRGYERGMQWVMQPRDVRASLAVRRRGDRVATSRRGRNAYGSRGTEK